MVYQGCNGHCNTGSVQLHVGQYVSGKPLQHPFDLVQASWTPCGGLGGWFHSRATDVAAPIAGLIGIGYVALMTSYSSPIYDIAYSIALTETDLKFKLTDDTP